MTFSLPEITISQNFYSILKIVFMVSVFIVIAFNILNAHATFLDGTNATDINWGMQDDDNLEEKEEQEDEKEHEKESKEWAKYADSEEANDNNDPYPENYYDENGNPKHEMSEDEIAEYNRNADKEHD